MTGRPYVLVVDDDPGQEAFVLRLQKAGVDADHVLPDDVTTHHLDRACLILVDEYLGSWPAREQVKDQPGLYVRDGVALAAVLRAQVEKRGPDVGEPIPSRTAIVLRTGHLGHLASGLPRHLWAPAVASRYDLEWVLQKTGASEELAEIGAIAAAAAHLPPSWHPNSPGPQLTWLALGEPSWADDAVAQIEQCRPPWSTLSATSDGRVWLAWFLQKILPFPTFLLDDLRAAAYLGLAPSGLESLLASPSDEAQRLGECMYGGELRDFAGRRWWRAGLADFRRDLVAGRSARGPGAAAERLVELHGSSLDVLGLSYPVFTIDHHYEVVPRPLEVTDAVRLQPDGWPSYADDPWLAIEDIEDEPELAMLVVLDDRDAAEGDGG